MFCQLLVWAYWHSAAHHTAAGTASGLLVSRSAAKGTRVFRVQRDDELLRLMLLGEWVAAHNMQQTLVHCGMLVKAVTGCPTARLSTWLLRPPSCAECSDQPAVAAARAARAPAALRCVRQLARAPRHDAPHRRGGQAVVAGVVAPGFGARCALLSRCQRPLCAGGARGAACGDH